MFQWLKQLIETALKAGVISHSGGPVSSAEQVIWDQWCSERYWDEVLTESLCFSTSHSFHQLLNIHHHHHHHHHHPGLVK
jgi:hypothetical protein